MRALLTLALASSLAGCGDGSSSSSFGGVTQANVSTVQFRQEDFAQTVQHALTAANLKASDGGAAGSNTIALAVAALAHATFSTSGGDAIDGTFSGFFGKSVIKLGEALATANSRVEDQENIERLVRGQRDAVSGVSLDEEMANLVKYQRSFQASSRVFTVLDELLDNVVNRLGRA